MLEEEKEITPSVWLTATYSMLSTSIPRQMNALASHGGIPLPDSFSSGFPFSSSLLMLRGSHLKQTPLACSLFTFALFLFCLLIIYFSTGESTPWALGMLDMCSTPEFEPQPHHFLKVCFWRVEGGTQTRGRMDTHINNTVRQRRKEQAETDSLNQETWNPHCIQRQYKGN